MFESSSSQKKVVESAREAREERALAKKKEVSAVRIQAFVRGVLVKHNVSKNWIEGLDKIIGFTDNEKSTNIKIKSNVSNYSNYELAANKAKPEDWKYATFSSNTLVGAFGNLAKDTNTNDAVPQKPKMTENNEFEMKSKETVNHPKNDLNSSQRIPSVELFESIIKFLFVFNKQRDKKRFKKLCDYLLTNIQQEKTSKFSYMYLCLHKQKAVAWIKQVKIIIAKCLQYIDEVHNTKKASAVVLGEDIILYLNLLQEFSSPVQWRIVNEKIPSNLIPVLKQMCKSFCHEMSQHGAVCTFGFVMQGIIENTSNMDVLSTLYHLCLCLIDPQQTEDTIKYVKHVLSVPGLVWYLRNDKKCMDMTKSMKLLQSILNSLQSEGSCTKHAIVAQSEVSVLGVIANLAHLYVINITEVQTEAQKFVLTMNQLFGHLHGVMSVQSGSSTTWHPVLGHCVNTDNRQMSVMLKVKEQMKCFWNGALLRSVYSDVLALQSLHKVDTMPAQAEQITARTVQKQTLSTKVSSYLRKFSKPRSVMQQTGGRSLEYADVVNTINTCIMYKTCLTVVTKQLRLEMLTGLTFVDEILTRLWRFICELGTSGGLDLFVDALKKVESAQPYFAVFNLFCDMTSHIISILDDVEFYEQQIPFHLEELVTISSSLTTFVFRIIWGRMRRSHSVEDVFESSHSLLLMLYDRDARRSFTPMNHWLCRDVKSSTIRSEVEKGTERALMLIDKIPFVLPHRDRVVLFRSLVKAEQSSKQTLAPITIHRSRIVEDGFQHLTRLPPQALKGVVRIKFINDLGLDEAGIDQDGVFKEFLEETITKVFNPDMNLFTTTTSDSKLYPSSSSFIQDDHLSLFRFVGMMLGKAVYDGIVVDVPFAIFFLRHLLSNQHNLLYSPLDELPSLDPEFCKNLTWIKRYEGDIIDLDLTFTHEENILGNIVTKELTPGGASIPVTNDNKIMYIHKLAHYRLHTCIREQTRAFIVGFRSVINKQWIEMFSAPELQRLISGDNVDIDLNDLKNNVIYYGGFHASHRVVRWLWDILSKEYDRLQRAAFLKFVTSCSRPPLLGFSNLQPQFSIRCVEVSDEEDTGDSAAAVIRGFFRISSSKAKNSNAKLRLPTASTCFNLLKLPNYPSKQVLRDKLNQAVANNTGFELS